MARAAVQESHMTASMCQPHAAVICHLARANQDVARRRVIRPLAAPEAAAASARGCRCQRPRLPLAAPEAADGSARGCRWQRPRLPLAAPVLKTLFPKRREIATANI